MKEQLRKLVALALFVLALSVAVLAQDLSPKVPANIPFNFYAGSKMLPAGTYIVAVDPGESSRRGFPESFGHWEFSSFLPSRRLVHRTWSALYK